MHGGKLGVVDKVIKEFFNCSVMITCKPFSERERHLSLIIHGMKCTFPLLQSSCTQRLKSPFSYSRSARIKMTKVRNVISICESGCGIAWREEVEVK